MNKLYWSPILNISAMILVIASRLSSENGFDLLAILASIVIALSLAHLIYIKLKSK